MRPLLEVAEFNEGYRYAEFNARNRPHGWNTGSAR